MWTESQKKAEMGKNGRWLNKSKLIGSTEFLSA